MITKVCCVEELASPLLVRTVMVNRTLTLITNTIALGHHRARVVAKQSHLNSRSRLMTSSALSFKLTATYASFICSCVQLCHS